MGPVGADGIGDDGDLRVLVDPREVSGHGLHKLHALLHGVEPGGPVEKDGVRVHVQARPLLELHPVGPLRLQDVVLGTVFPGRRWQFSGYMFDAGALMIALAASK